MVQFFQPYCHSFQRWIDPKCALKRLDDSFMFSRCKRYQVEPTTGGHGLVRLFCTCERSCVQNNLNLFSVPELGFLNNLYEACLIYFECLRAVCLQQMNIVYASIEDVSKLLPANLAFTIYLPPYLTLWRLLIPSFHCDPIDLSHMGSSVKPEVDAAFYSLQSHNRESAHFYYSLCRGNAVAKIAHPNLRKLQFCVLLHYTAHL